MIFKEKFKKPRNWIFTPKSRLLFSHVKNFNFMGFRFISPEIQLYTAKIRIFHAFYRLYPAFFIFDVLRVNSHS